MRSLILGVLIVAFVTLLPSGDVDAGEPTLWVSDDVGRRVYEVTLSGTFLSTFPTNITVDMVTFPISPSSVARDPTDDTLWVVQESPGRLINYDKSGNELQLIDVGFIPGPEGLAVDYFDGTLWVVDDPADPATPDKVYHLERDGSLIGSVLAADYAAAATSQQAIAADPVDGSLWVVDNITDQIYNFDVSEAGDVTPITSFATSTYDALANNPQGISVDETDGTVWVTDRNTQKIYNVLISGAFISSFASTTYDPLALNPTGVGFDPNPAVPLGRAGAFALFEMQNGVLSLRNANSSIFGDVGLGPNSVQNFSSGFIGGTLFVDPTADNSHSNSVQIDGGTVAADLSPALSDAQQASATAAALTTTRRFSTIYRSRTIVGSPGTNVIKVKRIDLTGRTLLLVGAPRDEFILNVSGTLRLRRRASIRIAGGIKPSRVLIHVQGAGPDVLLSGASSAAGTILAPTRNITLRSMGTSVDGAVLGGRNIFLDGGAAVSGPY